MPGLDYTFVQRPKNRFHCPLCTKPMREPMQVSTCGHRFCVSCLQEFLSRGVFKCPEDQLPLDYAKIFPDVELEQQILSLPIHCIHGEEGCGWIAPSKQLQAHLSVCEYKAVPCPNHCSVRLRRQNLLEHLQHDCLKRTVCCEFCSDQFTGKDYEDHQGDCPEESVYCENKCGSRMVRRLLSLHSLTECSKRKLACQHCRREFLCDTIQSHLLQCPRLPVQCPNKCGMPVMAHEDLPIHLKERCGTSLVLCPFKEAGCRHKCSKPALAHHFDEAAQSHLSLLCGVVNRQRLELRNLHRWVEELTGGHDGTLLWKLHDFSRHLQETKSRTGSRNLELFSPVFYSHRYGYRLQVSTFLNGNGCGEGSHVSVYIRVLPGEYDGILEWPFPFRVTFSLLDQSDPTQTKPRHINETFTPDPKWKNFQRPKPNAVGSIRGGALAESLLGFGYPKFISHQEIVTRNYIRDDVIFIRTSIDVQKIMN